MSGPTWVFDRAGASGQRKGGKPGDQIIGTKLSTLTREAGQNCRDQWLQNGQPVRVGFSIITLTGQHKTDFLKAVNWTVLGKHIDAAVAFGKTSPLARQLKKAKDRAENDDLILLRIDDFNTKGLLGGEDEADQNFQNLCKNEFVTPEKGGRGGSYGIGKQVYHRFSSVSSVIYSSYVDGPVDGLTRKGLRLFGRSQLVSHSLGKENYAPDGWFGTAATTPAGNRAESIWDDSALCAALQVGRGPADGRGTSILILGFFDAESGSSANPDPVQVAEKIIADAERWFWPSLSGPSPSLAIEAKVIKNGTVLHTFTADPQQNWAHFIRAFETPATDERAEKPGQIAESSISFRVPPRTEAPSHKAFDADLKLRVTREPATSKGTTPELGAIALVRGFGMVVRYFQPRNRPLTAEPFCGVLKVGTAADGSADADQTEEFFRASEPPLHDEWRHDTDSVRENYSAGAGVAFDTLWTEVSQKVVELCGIPQPDDDKGPKLLSRLLPFGQGDGKATKKSIQIRNVEAELTSSGWKVAGKAINTKFEKKPWSAHVLFFLRGEKGRGDGLAFSSLKVSTGVVTDLGPRAVIEVPGTESEITFTGVLDSGAMSLAELRRIKLGCEQ